MRYRTATVLQGIARPNGSIRIIQSVVVGVEISFFPSQMSLNYRPHFFHKTGVASPFEMTQHLVEKNQIHIIMVGNRIVVGSAADVTAGKQCRSDFFFFTG